jgi:hypothetical protein
VNIILRKQDRGSDGIACKKTRDKVVKALEPKIAAGNISCMLTSNVAADYVVAADALSWQTTLKGISRFCQQYDMMSLLKIPQDVDFSWPQQVAIAISFKDAIENWNELDDKTYYQWQEFILSYSTAIEIESDNWLEEVLHLSMEKNLRAEVESDINSIPARQRGSITTLRCIIKKMVIKNQEAKDSLMNYIRNFNITKFPGENVPMACLHLKAVAKSLGEADLPLNIIRKVLEGFGKSSTQAFNDFCSSQLALRRSSFYMDLMRGTSLLRQLNDLLHNLEATYLDLVGGNKWDGVIAKPSTLSFFNEVDDTNDELNSRAFAAKSNIPWEEWVKRFAICHYCGKQGHICPNCPDYLKKVASGEIKHISRRFPQGRSPRGHSNHPSPRGNRDHPPHRPDKNFLRNPKAKAFLSAFQALFCDDSDNDEDANETAQGNEDDRNDDDNDLQSFLSMVGSSLKE